jgi:hypothetical protein
MGAGQAQVFTQELNQQRPRIDVRRMHRSVDGYRDFRHPTSSCDAYGMAIDRPAIRVLETI